MNKLEKFWYDGHDDISTMKMQKINKTKKCNYFRWVTLFFQNFPSKLVPIDPSPNQILKFIICYYGWIPLGPDKSLKLLR